MLYPRENNSSPFAATILIVGTGPAGLFAACELLRHGVKPRVVERRLAPHGETRGTALQPAVLEIIDRAGLIELFLRAGVHIRHFQLLVEISTSRYQTFVTDVRRTQALPVAVEQRPSDTRGQTSGAERSRTC